MNELQVFEDFLNKRHDITVYENFAFVFSDLSQ